MQKRPEGKLNDLEEYAKVQRINPGCSREGIGKENDRKEKGVFPKKRQGLLAGGRQPVT
jgi:hypothetical protein